MLAYLYKFVPKLPNPDPPLQVTLFLWNGHASTTGLSKEFLATFYWKMGPEKGEACGLSSSLLELKKITLNNKILDTPFKSTT